MTPQMVERAVPVSEVFSKLAEALKDEEKLKNLRDRCDAETLEEFNALVRKANRFYNIMTV